MLPSHPQQTNSTPPPPPPSSSTQKLQSSSQSLHDQLHSINDRIAELLSRLQKIDVAAQQERAGGQSLALINTDNGARVGVTHSLQQLGRERMDIVAKLAAAPAPPPSTDIASDFQVIESHLHAVAAKVQSQRMEESRHVGCIHARAREL